jgi:lipopolysaccharide heptosyltransferase II
MIDHVILFLEHRHKSPWYTPWGFWQIIRFLIDLRQRQFDLVIDLQGLLRSAIAARATGASVIVGFSNAREGAPVFYTDRVDCSWESDHAVERYLKITDALGCPGDRVEFPFAVDDDDRQFIANLIPRDLRYAVLMPGTLWETKRWPAEKFAALVQPLKNLTGLQCVVTGGPNETALAAQIPAHYDLTGKTDLRQMIALLERADLVIAADTGPMHIAAALGKPLVTPYGPTDAVRTGPFARQDSVIRLDIPCSPCFSRTCSHQSCLNWLGIDPVLKLAQEQIARYGASLIPNSPDISSVDFNPPLP